MPETTGAPCRASGRRLTLALSLHSLIGAPPSRTRSAKVVDLAAQRELRAWIKAVEHFNRAGFATKVPPQLAALVGSTGSSCGLSLCGRG